MEQWYKDGNIFNSQQAIRNDNPNSSLPHFLSDNTIEELGYLKVVDVKPIYNEAAQYIVEGDIVLIGGVPTKHYTVVDYTTEELAVKQAEATAQLIQHFTDVTTNYIEAKVQAYNKANGVAFRDIDAFTKYALNMTSPYNSIAMKFIAYADNVWSTVRAYQATATTVPTDEEFKTLLDSVVF